MRRVVILNKEYEKNRANGHNTHAVYYENLDDVEGDKERVIDILKFFGIK